MLVDQKHFFFFIVRRLEILPSNGKHCGDTLQNFGCNSIVVETH